MLLEIDEYVPEPGMVALAGWVAATALTGVVGNGAFAAIKAKVLGKLADFRQRTGQAVLDELQQSVFTEMEKYRSNGKLTEEELRKRIGDFFAQLRE